MGEQEERLVIAKRTSDLSPVAAALVAFAGLLGALRALSALYAWFGPWNTMPVPAGFGWLGAAGYLVVAPAVGVALAASAWAVLQGRGVYVGVFGLLAALHGLEYAWATGLWDASFDLGLVRSVAHIMALGIGAGLTLRMAWRERPLVVRLPRLAWPSGPVWTGGLVFAFALAVMHILSGVIARADALSLVGGNGSLRGFLVVNVIILPAVPVAVGLLAARALMRRDALAWPVAVGAALLLPARSLPLYYSGDVGLGTSLAFVASLIGVAVLVGAPALAGLLHHGQPSPSHRAG